LEAYYQDHSTTFRTPGNIAFDQVFYDPKTSPHNKLQARIAQDKKRLNAPGAAGSVTGDISMLPADMNAPLPRVAQNFGDSFAEQLEGLPVGKWSGPVSSTFGWHLVRVRQKVPPTLPPLESVQEEVLRDWQREQRQKLAQENYQKLQARYDVIFEAPASDD